MFHNRSLLQMHSIRSIIHGQIPKHFLINSPSLFLYLSTTSSPTDLQPHFMVNYLISSLKLSKPEATSVTSKIHHLKSSKNPQSVINFLKTYNLSEPEIKSIVISHPHILLRNVDKTLAPKFKHLSELGFSSQDIALVIKKDNNLLGRSLHTSIIPTINLLMNILGCKENMVKAVKKSFWPFYGKYFKMNVSLLERYGFCRKDIGRIVLRDPRLVTQKPERLEEKLVEIESFGLSPSSLMFSYGLSAISSLSKLKLKNKFEVFKSFGWSDTEIFDMVNRQPVIVTHSEERLKKGLGFFMEELGYTSAWLSTHGILLMYNLEKRVKPRYKVYVALKEKGVMARKLNSLMCISDEEFVKSVVLRHKEDMPHHLYDSFTKMING